MAVFPALTTAIPPILIGKPWSQTFNYQPAGVTANLTGYSAELRVMTGSHTGATLILSQTSGGGDITLGSVDPNITVTITDADTTALTEASAYAYLTLTTGGGTEIPVLEGPVQIKFWGV